MLTKRSTLSAGALALALFLGACSPDRPGGATGVDDVRPTAPAPRQRPAAPLEAAAPGSGGAVAPDNRGGGESVATITTTSYEGHEIILSRVVTTAGGVSTRVTLDGQRLMEVRGDMRDMTEGTEAATQLYDQGELVMDGQLLLGTSRARVPTATGGPQRQQLIPCAAEIAAFGSASVAMSYALYMARLYPTPTNIRNVGRAATVLLTATFVVVNCLAKFW